MIEEDFETTTVFEKEGRGTSNGWTIHGAQARCDVTNILSLMEARHSALLLASKKNKMRSYGRRILFFSSFKMLNHVNERKKKRKNCWNKRAPRVTKIIF